MKRILFFLAALMPLISTAQELRVPDNDRIFAEIFDQSSKWYYPSLMARYAAGDPDLTDEDYHYLYYGFAFQPEYRPLEPNPAAADILTILERSPEPDSTASRKIIASAREVFLLDPFSPTNLNMMAYAQAILGETEEARTNAIRVEKILFTIKNSGTGLSERSPWAILAFSHADDALASMGLQAANRRVVSRTVEFVGIGARGEKIKGYFFDFSRIYWNKPGNLPQKGPQGFQINGIKVK